MKGEGSKSSKKLEKTMRNLLLGVSKREGGEAQVEISPGCAFGALVEERLKNMERNLQEVKGRINGLIYLIITLVVTEVIMRFF